MMRRFKAELYAINCEKRMKKLAVSAACDCAKPQGAKVGRLRNFSQSTQPLFIGDRVLSVWS